jgi:hypothetical protein
MPVVGRFVSIMDNCPSDCNICLKSYFNGLDSNSVSYTYYIIQPTQTGLNPLQPNYPFQHTMEWFIDNCPLSKKQHRINQKDAVESRA